MSAADTMRIAANPQGRHPSFWPLGLFRLAFIDARRDDLSTLRTTDFGLAPQPRSISHHAIAAERTSDLDLRGGLQWMVDQGARTPSGSPTYHKQPALKSRREIANRDRVCVSVRVVQE
jgi:hypothetical protein